MTLTFWATTECSVVQGIFFIYIMETRVDNIEVPFDYDLPMRELFGLKMYSYFDPFCFMLPC
jgi:hypothetical protein